jgi:hypothetical protein
MADRSADSSFERLQPAFTLGADDARFGSLLCLGVCVCPAPAVNSAAAPSATNSPSHSSSRTAIAG